jgi:hypothetical protein
MYIRIIYPSTLITIGGTALCLEQKNLGSETETGPVKQSGIRAPIIANQRGNVIRAGGFFSLRVGLPKIGLAYFSFFDSK